MKGNVIGLWSPAPQSGKTTAAAVLVELLPKARIVPFAEPLKLMAAPLLRMAGYTAFDANRYLFREKELTLDFLPGEPTSRHLLQTLGTEWGRDCMGVDFWTELWKRRVQACLCGPWKYVIVDDVRFPNEVEAVKAMRGEVWGVVRPGVTDFTGHRSEQNLSALVQRVIRNDGTIEQLRCSIKQTLELGVAA